MLKNWGIVFAGNFLGAFTVAVLMAMAFTYGFSTEPGNVGGLTFTGLTLYATRIKTAPKPAFK